MGLPCANIGWYLLHVVRQRSCGSCAECARSQNSCRANTFIRRGAWGRGQCHCHRYPARRMGQDTGPRFYARAAGLQETSSSWERTPTTHVVCCSHHEVQNPCYTLYLIHNIPSKKLSGFSILVAVQYITGTVGLDLGRCVPISAQVGASCPNEPPRRVD